MPFLRTVPCKRNSSRQNWIMEILYRWVMMECGKPWSLAISLMNSKATMAEVNRGFKLKKGVNLERRSTTTNIVSMPWNFGNLSTKPMVIFSQTKFRSASGWNNPDGAMLSVFVAAMLYIVAHIYWYPFASLPKTIPLWCYSLIGSHFSIMSSHSIMVLM